MRPASDTVTALASKRNYPVHIDDSVLRHSVLAISAGVRVTQILLTPQDYIRATTATSGAIARQPVG
jgi:Cys-tRNA(Pro)/Cys-tRNA(Cys) deacylase